MNDINSNFSSMQENAIGVLLKLRWIQLKKIAYESGSYAVFFVFVFLAAVAFTYFVHRDEQGSLKLFGLLGAVILFLHHSRKDRSFVFKHVPNPHLEMTIEYFVLSFPFLFFGIYFMRFEYLLLLLIALFMVPYINIEVKQETFNKTIKHIPTPMFEWKSGVRRTYFPFILLYAIALCSSWFKILPLIVLWFLTTLIMTFYDENEPQNFLNEGNATNEKHFLNGKIISHVKILLVLYIPILLINTIFNIDFIWINILYLMAQVSLLVFGITTKYKHYVPSFNLITNSSFTSIIVLIGALPIFFIIPFLLAVVNYFKALTNLKPYFQND
jgi:hypothetical protein